MNLRMQRVWYEKDGIISNVFTEDGVHLLTTLEHAYWDTDHSTYLPKVLPGTYDCVRGLHALHDGKQFETFEVEGVVGHSGILFHHGNWNRDSEGCILTGDSLDRGVDKKDGQVHDLVVNTDAAFARFMKCQEGVNHFQLRVLA